MKQLIISINKNRIEQKKNIRMTQSVKVMVRCRPMNSKEIEKSCKNVVIVDKETRQIGLKKISQINTTVKNFTYDYVFDEYSTQQEVYEQSSFSLVENVLNGYNATIFAYGQTGCGKTHTMLGVTTTLSTKKSYGMINNKQNLAVTVTNLTLEDETMGIIPRAFRQIMTVINSQPDKNHLIQCTFIEIYNEQIHDLLGKDNKAKINLQQTPQGLIMKDLSVHLAKNVSDMEKYMEIGYKNRVIRETSMNKESSRSHCIFTIRIQESQMQNGLQKFRVGKLNLVDLAGSQRQSKTNLRDEGIKEAAKINLSLSALGNVISALVDGKKDHIPYRDSKLTRILNDSLGGNTKTVMIATISPADYNYEETLSTLRYSSRAKFIQNKPMINQDPKDALLRKYEEQIKRLKAILEGKLPYVRGNDTFYINPDNKQPSFFQKFPELRNQQNQAIINQINQALNQIQNIDGQNNKQNSDHKDQKQQRKNVQNSTEKGDQVLQLKKQLNFLQQIVKKQTNTSPQALIQLQKINQLKQKLKQQALKQEKYKQQQKKRQQQLLTIEKNYKNLNDEVDQIKQKFHDLRIKYIQATQEIKDAREAHQKEKEQILEALRIQQAENNKLMEILNVILNPSDLQKIFKNCQWLNDSKSWIVPKFNYSQKNGITLGKSTNDISRSLVGQNLMKESKKLTKDNKQMRQTNLMIQQQKQRNTLKRFSKSERKIVPQISLNRDTQSKFSRSQSQRDQLKDMNLFKSKQTKRSFKNSYYSDSNLKQQLNQQRANSKYKQQQKLFEKYKFSLQPLPKLKSVQDQIPIKASIDLEQIKRQIMSEIKDKNKSNNKKY